MADQVQLPVEVATKIRERFLQQEEQIKVAHAKAGEALEKIAAVQRENSVLRDVLRLTAEGVFDPREAIEKIAEYMQDSSKLEVMKAAHELGIDRLDSRLGEPVAEASGSREEEGKNPIADTLSDLLDRGLISG